MSDHLNSDVPLECDVCKADIHDKAKYFFGPDVDGGDAVVCAPCQFKKNYTEMSEFRHGERDWWEDPSMFEETVDSYKGLQSQSGNAKGGKVVAERKPDEPSGVLVCKGVPKFSYGNMEVMLTQAVYNQLFFYVDESSIEISGIGRIEKRQVGNKIFLIIHEIFLLKQRNTAASTHLDQGELTNFLLERVRQQLPVGDIKFWWHSHVNMQAFWSGTDDACCDGFEIDGQDKDNWFLSIVVNKRREMRCRLDIYKPHRVIIDELPIKVIMNFSDTDKDLLRKEVEEKCHDDHSFWPKGSWNRGNYHIPQHTAGSSDTTSHKQIVFAFANDREGDLKYFADMTDEGKMIEVLHYRYTDDLYRLFLGNKKVPVGHKVPSLASMQKNRDWYLDRYDNLYSKTKNSWVRNHKDLKEEEEILFYKHLRACKCEWCDEQRALIKLCQEIREEKETKPEDTKPGGGAIGQDGG